MSCHKEEVAQETNDKIVIRNDDKVAMTLKLKCRKDCENCREKEEPKKSTEIGKAILLPCLLLFGSIGAFAQDLAPGSKGFWEDPLNHPLLSVYLVTALVFFVLILVVAVAILAQRVLNIIIRKAAEEMAAKLGLPYVAPQGAWSKFWQKANAMAPQEEEKNIELDHNYDGIKELDNHLPPWWKGLFYGSIIFAVVYMVAYHFSGALPLSTQEYEGEVAKAEEQARKLKASQPAELIDLNTLTFSKDEALISRGRQLFVSNNCGSCHRNDGGGNTIGPNLTDAYWLHGGDVKDIFSTINNGVIEKAMPAWGKTMSQKDVRDLTFFVMSLQGSNPDNPKKPQGELNKPVVIAADSTKISMKK